jgi:hypothetical protein
MTRWGIQPACSKAVNESRGKQRIVRTIFPAFKLQERKKEEGVVIDSSVLSSHLLVGVMTHPRVGKMPCPVRGCVIAINRGHKYSWETRSRRRTAKKKQDKGAARSSLMNAMTGETAASLLRLGLAPDRLSYPSRKESINWAKTR